MDSEGKHHASASDFKPSDTLLGILSSGSVVLPRFQGLGELNHGGNNKEKLSFGNYGRPKMELK